MAKKTKSQDNKGRGRRSNAVFNDVLSLGGNLLMSKKEWIAEKISNLSSATHAYAGALNDIPGIGTYANVAAQSFDDFAQYIDETDLDDMVRDGSVFARRHPVPALASAIIAGIIATQIYRIEFKSR
jgi:hypothetical protein